MSNYKKNKLLLEIGLNYKLRDGILMHVHVGLIATTDGKKSRKVVE